MAADLARARARANRIKRPYQPTLAAYFRLPSHPASLPLSSPTHDQHTHSHLKRDSETRLAALEGSVQASLLNVGMRVRKAVSGGYQRHAVEYSGKAGYGGLGKENQMRGEDGRDDALGKRRRIDEEEEEEEEEEKEDVPWGSFWFSKRPPTDADATGRPEREKLISESSGQRRRMAQPTMRLRRREEPRLSASLDIPVGAPMDVDFDEADFLRPRSEVELDGSEAAMEVG